MFCHTLAVYVLGCLLQILPQIPSVNGAVIPQSADITATGSTLGASPVYCNDLEGFVGKGIVRADCEAAIREFLSTTVRPRGNQEYEFLSREVHPVSHLPTVVTPTRFSHGGYPSFSLGFGLSHSTRNSRHVRLYRSNDGCIQLGTATRRSAKNVPKE